MKRTFVDRAADFVLAVERVFGERPRVLDGSRAVQLGDCPLLDGDDAGEIAARGRGRHVELPARLGSGEGAARTDFVHSHCP